MGDARFGHLFSYMENSQQACTCFKANCSSSLGPLLYRKYEAVGSSRCFNPIEFDGIKTWIIERFSDSKIIYCVLEPEPIAYNHIGSDRVWLICPNHISQTDKIAPIQALTMLTGFPLTVIVLILVIVF